MILFGFNYDKILDNPSIKSVGVVTNMYQDPKNENILNKLNNCHEANFNVKDCWNCSISISSLDLAEKKILDKTFWLFANQAANLAFSSQHFQQLVVYMGPDFNPGAFTHVDTNNHKLSNSGKNKQKKQMAFISRDNKRECVLKLIHTLFKCLWLKIFYNHTLGGRCN